MRDCILLRDTTYVLKTLMGDYVVTEDIYVLRELWLEVCTEFLDILLEVLIDIILKTTNTIVVLEMTVRKISGKVMALNPCSLT